MTTTTSSRNGATHTWPPFETREPTPQERAEALLQGIRLLEDLLRIEDERLEPMRKLLRLAQAIADHERDLTDPIDQEIWKIGLEILDWNCFGEQLDDPLVSATAGATNALGIVSGYCTLSRGGDTGCTDWTALRPDMVADQIERFRRAD